MLALRGTSSYRQGLSFSVIAVCGVTVNSDGSAGSAAAFAGALAELRSSRGIALEVPGTGFERGVNVAHPTETAPIQAANASVSRIMAITSSGTVPHSQHDGVNGVSPFAIEMPRRS